MNSQGSTAQPATGSGVKEAGATRSVGRKNLKLNKTNASTEEVDEDFMEKRDSRSRQQKAAIPAVSEPEPLPEPYLEAALGTEPEPRRLQHKRGFREASVSRTPAEVLKAKASGE